MTVTDQAVTHALPRYRSHKIVEAAKIVAFAIVDGVTTLALDTGAHVPVAEGYVTKHVPRVGGYYVRYADGYESWSPAAAFEDGYTPAAVPVEVSNADVERIARVCHEANKGWCAAHGDDSQLTWDLAPTWQRESARSGVRFVLAHPDAGDAAQHENWSRDKVADGWVYGPVKDADAKTHPCLVPFDQLPAEQQAKDRLFRAIVLALVPSGVASA